MNNVIIHEIPEGYKARIEGNKVIIERDLFPLELKIISWILEDSRLHEGEWMHDKARERAKEVMSILTEDKTSSIIDGHIQGKPYLPIVPQPISADDKNPRWETPAKFPKEKDMFFINDGFLYCGLNRRRINLSTLLYLPNDDN